MNFGKVIKEELIAKPIKDKHCKKAFLAGLFRGSATLFSEGDQLGVDITLFSESLAEYTASLLQVLFDYEIREVGFYEDRLNKRDRVVLSIVGEKATEILKELEVLTENNFEFEVNLDFYGEITKKECCLKNFIKGLFMASGSCSIPDAGETGGTGYHLELVFSHYTSALKTSEKLAEFGIITKITRRKDSYVVYIKSAEEIKDFIAFLPAPISVLKMTDLIINREIANNSNRQKNCDLGNVSKQVEASAKQIQAIEKIDQVIGINSLKEEDRIVANARKEFPDETLSELAERLNISKSCLNHRLRKLVCIANEL